jgi:hypothetical protein
LEVRQSRMTPCPDRPDRDRPNHGPCRD